MGIPSAVILIRRSGARENLPLAHLCKDAVAVRIKFYLYQSSLGVVGSFKMVDFLSFLLWNFFF